MSTWGKRFVMQVTLTLSFIMVPLLSGLQAAALEEKQPALSTSGSLLPLPVVYNTISIGAAHIWVTDEVGFFRKHGLDVALIETRINNGYPFNNRLCYGACDPMEPLDS
jgi:ABC-type nitrate/sulfonate/bicarbonate transport system substrate-binding protein